MYSINPLHIFIYLRKKDDKVTNEKREGSKIKGSIEQRRCVPNRFLLIEEFQQFTFINVLWTFLLITCASITIYFHYISAKVNIFHICRLFLKILRKQHSYDIVNRMIIVFVIEMNFSRQLIASFWNIRLKVFSQLITCLFHF